MKPTYLAFLMAAALPLFATTPSFSGAPAEVATKKTPPKEIRLPDFGRSANAGVSEREEYYYGLQLLREFRNGGLLIEDPEIDEYLRTLATRLGEASSAPDENFTYVLFNDDEFNAFAVPGGLIAVHAGLWLQAGNESELAAVLAHETAHVTQKHVVRAMERTQKASLPIMLGTLATAIAASQQSGSGRYSPYDNYDRVDSTMGVLVAGQALIQQLQINFTRDNEFEADRIGIQNLKKAGFDVTSMAGMFQRMQTAFRTGSSNRPPQYLQTHPITTTRIAEAKTRAAQLLDKPVLDKGLQFTLMRERVRALRQGDVTGNQRYYEDSIAARKDSIPLWYGFALHHLRQRNVVEAKAALAKIPATPELALTRQLLEADIALAAKDSAWRGMYERMLTATPNHRVVATKYVRALLSSDLRADGVRAVDILRELTERVSDDPNLYEQLSRAHQVAGDSVRAGEAFAYATALRGAFEDSLLQLQNITARKDLDYYERARIDAQITELMPIVLELRKRNIDARSAQVGNGVTRPAIR